MKMFKYCQVQGRTNIRNDSATMDFEYRKVLLEYEHFKTDSILNRLGFFWTSDKFCLFKSKTYHLPPSCNHVTTLAFLCRCWYENFLSFKQFLTTYSFQPYLVPLQMLLEYENKMFRNFLEVLSCSQGDSNRLDVGGGVLLPIRYLVFRVLSNDQ